MIRSQDALKFSMWLAATHPAAFRAVWNTVVPRAPRAFNGLGAVSDEPIRHRQTQAYRAARRRGMGRLGDDSGLETITVEAPIPDVSSFDFSSLSVDPALQDINVSADINPSMDLSGLSAASDTSGGFWSSLGSGLSSMGSGIASAIGSVASAVANPATLSAAGNIAASVIKANATTQQAQQQAQLQQQVLQSQLARTATGTGVAPIRYFTNPTTGQTQPYYYNASTGQYQATQPSVLSPFSFGSTLPGTMPSYLPYLLIGGGVLAVIALTAQRTRA